MNRYIPLADFDYPLPDERIAKSPLPKRDESKLLLYRSGAIDHHIFREIPSLLPADALLVFNDTKVIPARLEFRKPTGAAIELFLLHPADASMLPQLALQQTGSIQWQCMIGNSKRWRSEEVLENRFGGRVLQATMLDRASGTVGFSWRPETLTFAEVISEIGSTPLPPYLNREATPDDKERYQTVYSQHAGAVAAPTAGLHFTEEVIQAVRQRGLETDFLTLHVSAGTFQPVKTENAFAHTMHAEQIIISKANVENLTRGKPVVAVGTTSMRSLESLYWFGVKLLEDSGSIFSIEQDLPYQMPVADHPSLLVAMQAVHQHMNTSGADWLVGHTSIYIVPGYQFKVCRGLITNFHQPQSTLMLLIAAFVGDDWRKIYDTALAGGYRFLSYGDSSLLLP